MKTVVLCIFGLLFCLFLFGQGIIQSDTAITKTIRVNQSFKLQFLNSPGTGYTWHLPDGYDTTGVSIQLLKQELAEGNKPIGGNYIAFYKYTGLTQGNFLIEYVYSRPWLKEKLYKCILKVTVI